MQDLDDLTRLEQAAFAADGFHRQQLRYLLTRANASIYVADEAGSVQGSAIMLWRKRTKVGRLYSIATAPSARGKGVGHLLLQTCEQAAVQQSCREVSLEVRITNLSAITFYERHGYRAIEQIPNFYEDGTTALRMRKPLLHRQPCGDNTTEPATNPGQDAGQINHSSISIGAVQKPWDDAHHHEIRKPGGQERR